jgi:MFS superfamily sulfate permease-like transporter
MINLRKIFDRPTLSPDLMASLVVFLVALPLCMGIAIASGVPPARGLVTGIVGGIVVGFISGSPLQVSGPAAGLAVVVSELVQNYGIEMLGPVVLLAGLIQAIAGFLKFGQIFRAMSPAVIYGMMAGIGVLICASQLQVAIDAKPYAHGIENLLAVPKVIDEALLTGYGSIHHLAAIIAIITVFIMLLWDKLKPAKLGLLPGALPMTGVIARSSVNVEAGAKTRLSAILHGCWF